MHVLKRITWPHEVEYNNAGESTMFEEMNPNLFTFMEKESDPVKTIMLGQLQELMEDSEVDGWEAVKA